MHVFPVFSVKHDNDTRKIRSVQYHTAGVSKALAKACRLLKLNCKITWYSARASFITRMVDEGFSPYIVAEMAGNSPMIIYKHYYKNTHGEDMLKNINSIFGE